MTKYAYYPGCSLETGAKEYDTSVRGVFGKLDLGLTEIPDWSCCGSSQAHKVDRGMATAIAGRNLVLASDIGDIVAPCASCSLTLKEAIIELEHEGPERAVLKDAGYEYLPGSVNVVSAVEAVYRALRDGQFEGKIKNPLEGLKVAAYYGCLLVRPPEVAKFDDPENPTSMDKIMEAAGATPVNWSHKTECCGNAYIMVDKNMTLSLVTKIINAADRGGADIIVTACPLCQSNVEARHSLLQQKFGLKRSIPVVYFTQLLGVALGVDKGKLAMDDGVYKLIAEARQAEKVVG